MATLEELKSKYAPALRKIEEQGVKLHNLHVHDNKLVIKGAAPSDAAKNEVWTAIKNVDQTFTDLLADITIDPSLPAPKQEDLLQTVLSAQNGGALAELGNTFGLDRGQAAAAVGQLLPALAAGLSRNASHPGGLEGLMTALAGGTHQRYIDDPSTLANAGTVQDGNGILGHILGSKDVSRQVAAQASARTGIGADVLQKMLPLVATLAMGALSKQTAGAARGGTAAAAPGLLGMLTPLLDSNKDGSVADDVMGMMGKFLR